MSRSALSETIRRLENFVGIQHLNRTTCSVSPTPAGERLAARFGVAFGEIQSALSEAGAMGGEIAGLVRVHAQRLGYELFLRSLLPDFVRRFPKINVEVEIDDAGVDIVQKRFDVGIRLEETLDQDVIAFPLQPGLRQVAVAAPSYIDQHGAPSIRVNSAIISVSVFAGRGMMPCTTGNSAKTASGSLWLSPVH